MAEPREADPAQLSEPEAARRLGVSSATVLMWLAEGSLASLSIGDVENLRADLDREWDAQGKRLA